MKDNYITITQLSRYLKYKFDHDMNLAEVYLRGEISNFKAHTRGHLYFTLKDETSRINAVMFSYNVKLTPHIMVTLRRLELLFFSLRGRRVNQFH